MVNDISEIQQLLNKAKTGRASQETLMYLDKFFTVQSKDCWKRLLSVTHKGKTEKQLLTEFLAIQAEAKIISDMNQAMVVNNVEGDDAEEKLRIIQEEIKKENNR
jgi:hypothetical protein